MTSDPSSDRILKNTGEDQETATSASDFSPVQWQHGAVRTPMSTTSVPVVVAKGIPYRRDSNCRQRLNIYLPATEQNSRLVGTPANQLPTARDASTGPRFVVHVHGGAWRDPALTATSIEPTVAHAFATAEPGPIAAVASLDYRLSPFPTHPRRPYDRVGGGLSDSGREAIHPEHVEDVLHGLALLRTFGLTDESYILSGHSCGACIAAQATLASPRQLGLTGVTEPPRPAALLGLNGLYDLPALVDDLGPAHQHLRDEYATLLTNAFGADRSRWPAASPALFEPTTIEGHLAAKAAPRIVLLDQSPGDELVPMNQKDRITTQLGRVAGMRVVNGRRCTGSHADPWKRGDMCWLNVLDLLGLWATKPDPLTAPEWWFSRKGPLDG